MSNAETRMPDPLKVHPTGHQMFHFETKLKSPFATLMAVVGVACFTILGAALLIKVFF